MAETIKNLIKRNPLLYGLLFPAIYLRRVILRYRNSLEIPDCFAFLFEPVIAGTLVVRLPSYEGDFEIDVRSHLLSIILTTKDYEPENNELIKRYVHQEKDAIDIGANIGLFTILLSKLISSENRVLAIEPNPQAVELLQKNIARNECSKQVTVYEGVVGQEAGSVVLKAIPGLADYSCIESITHPAMQARSIQAYSVPATSLDDLVVRFKLRPGFIKIDTEGSEYLVLSGAINTLKKHRPVVICEVRDDLLACISQSSEEIVLFLNELGYRVINIQDQDEPIKPPFIGDILALPLEYGEG